MRLSKERVRHLAEALTAKLEAEGHIVLSGPRQSFVDLLDRTVTDELSIEDKLNAEVRQLLKTYEHEIERGNVDYQKMFMMLKSKLVRERGLVL
ncbi:hypothetical protein W02_41780 [Nitrospira sp. KM1]|uniref:DUF507 family protein n=1 Tax=Nitrospira sp. KM1 TaxID=1936990 RepID=UPI0013A76DE8|nr:DUF507 family protein [Nitrospira sp. KM1]BCA57038.1 hypothetical protein W02_41780 [Nitrospira sp. KM1]